MSSYNQQEKPWKRKLKRAVLIIVSLALAIGLLALAGSANSKAKKNMAAINVPDYKLWYLPGGPDRFSEEYNRAIEDLKEDQKIDKESFVWGSVVLENVGKKEGDEVSLEIDAAIPLDHVLISLSGYGNEASLTIDEEDNTKATIDLKSVSTYETIHVFVGFDPELSQDVLEQQLANWNIDSFQKSIEEIRVESDGDSAAYYGFAIGDLS